jgi:asparagine synthase (glutamine-hydrolysing)
MCGLVGFVDFSKKINQNRLDIATDKMQLRGPDARGTLIKQLENYNIGFGHRRLAILDIDERSNQPFVIDHVTIVFNGEIYNFNEIKDALILLGVQFKTTSDTEVILQSYLAWGQDCVKKFKGMFAFFLYDAIKEEILVVRDRLGVKPLYFFKNDTQLIVASQVSAILPLLDQKLTIDEAALHGFFALGYVPGEHAIYKEIKKIKPASVNVIKLKKDIESEESIYWKISNKESNLNETEKIIQLESILKDAIELRQISDVKVGSFLSGGLDSSYVTKIMKANTNDLNSFTIGFDAKFDEAPHAQKVADFIGTTHHSHYLKAEEIQDIITNFSLYFDEPFSDDAAIPMLFLSRKAKKEVKVVVSSDGGDEVFAGYSRYTKVLKVHEKLNIIPTSFLKMLKKSAYIIFNLLPKRNKISNGLWRFYNIIDLNKDKQLANLIFYADRIPTPELNRIIESRLTNIEFTHNFYQINNFKTPLKQLLFIDLKERLVNQMLVKVDKATMGASIEGREPLLDHRLFEFMASCKDEDLIRNNITKFLFRKVIQKEFDYSEILNKPKLGFNTPIYDWLRISFADYVESEFKSIDSCKIPYLKQDELLKMWEEFKVGKTYYQNLIWRSLIWIQWYKKCI